MSADISQVNLQSGAGENRIKSLAFITSQAFSLGNFRGSLIRELTGRGIHCYALAPDFDDKFRNQVRELDAEPVDITMRRAAINPLRDLRDMLSLAGILRRIKPDAVICYFIKPVIFGTLAARLAGIPYRYCFIEGAGHVFSSDTDDTGIRQKIMRFIVRELYRISLRLTEKVFLLNSDDEKLFVDDLEILDSEKVVMLPGIGLDLSRFRKQPPVISPVTFILVARLLARKGVREYADAARKLKKQYPDTRFLLVGDIDDNPGSLTRPEINKWVEAGFIEWTGHVDDVRPWLGQSSVMVLPSYYREGMPRSLMEAMAVGRALITTDMPGCRETVLEGRNGFLVQPRNVPSLVSAMEKFIHNPELITEMGEASHGIAVERFDVDKINSRILEKIL